MLCAFLQTILQSLKELQIALDLSANMGKRSLQSGISIELCVAVVCDLPDDIHAYIWLQGNSSNSCKFWQMQCSRDHEFFQVMLDLVILRDQDCIPECCFWFAGRYVTPQSISTFQVASTNLVSLSYVQKVSEKVPLPLFQPTHSPCENI